jgi:hypothetical protein
MECFAMSVIPCAFPCHTDPYAMQWAVTIGHAPDPRETENPASINRAKHDPGPIESTWRLADDWAAGLEARS